MSGLSTKQLSGASLDINHFSQNDYTFVSDSELLKWIAFFKSMNIMKSFYISK